jgi:predicted O-methyltransferase YrrM
LVIQRFAPRQEKSVNWKSPIMLPLVEDILTTKQVRTVDGSATLPLRDSIDLEIGNLLQKLIAEHRPSITMEIGLAYGLSTLCICEALTKVGGCRHIPNLHVARHRYASRPLCRLC